MNHLPLEAELFEIHCSRVLYRFVEAKSLYIQQIEKHLFKNSL